MVAETALNVEWKKDLKTWKQGRAIFKLQMAATISDSLFMKICDKAEAIEKRTQMFSLDLRHRLQ